jgi:hypothetical protein
MTTPVAPNPNTVKVIAVGDPHFQVSNVTDCELLVRKLCVLVDAVKPDFVVILGDTLHMHEKIHVTPLNVVNKLFKKMSERVLTFVLIGNHDMINHSQFLTANHGFNAYKKWPNLVICDKVKIYETKGQKFVFCPFVPNGRFVEALDTSGAPAVGANELTDAVTKGDPPEAAVGAPKRPWADATCIFAHQEFFGCRFNPVQTSTEGDLWPEDYPMVVSGHIHAEQRLQSNIYYPGSSMQHGFAETEDKVVASLNFTKGEPFGLRRVDLGLPKRKTFYIDVQKADAFVPPKGVIVKLVVQGTPEQFKVFRRGIAYKELTTKRGVKITFAPKGDVAAVEGKRPESTKQSVSDILAGMVKESGNSSIQRAYEKLVS